MNGSGSGFIADDDGLIVTNFHVIEDAYYAKIFYYDGTESNVNMLYAYDEEWDLAALKTTPSFVKYVTIENYDKVEIGSVCFAIGSPRGIANTISDGIVSNKLTYKSGYIYQITSPISPGSSGGALFNEYGKLIGVTTSYRPDGQNLNYAIPSEYVADLIDGPFVPVSLPNFQKKYKKPTSYPEKRPIEKQPIEKKPNEEIIKPDIVENELQENTAIGFTPNSYSLSTGFNFYTSSVTNNFPSFIEFEKAFNFSFSYLFNNYSV
ncbi:MAG: serine protease [Ignavibacteria bacterium]|nr:serine protease [Ignavibacteria bacterium]